jgi:hypothetical protein
MRHLLLFSAILIVTSCSTNKPVNFDQLQDRGGLFYLANDKEPFTGDVISYQGGRPVLEGHMKNGLRDGLWIFYYASGQKQAEGTYADGLKEGTWTYCKENGEQDVVEIYKMGNRLGNEQQAAADSVAPPEDPAKPAGAAKAAPQQTQVEEKVADPEPVKAKEPEKPKPVVWERLRGGPVKTLDGVPYTGDVVKYLSTGGLELQGHFTDGRRSGKWTFYWPNGNVKDVRYY